MGMKCIFVVVVCLQAGVGDPFTLFDDGETNIVLPTPHVVPLIISNNRVFTRVSVDGAPERLFILDNGCSHVILDPRVYPDNSSDQVAGVSVNAMELRRAADIGRIGKLRLGSRHVSSLSVLRSNIFRKLNQHTRRRIAGIAGYNLFCGQLVTVDLQRQRMCFIPRFDGSSELLISMGAIRLPFGNNLLPPPNEHVFSVSIILNGRNTEAFLDLGFPGELLTTLPHDEFGLVVNSRSSKTELAILGMQGTGYLTRAISMEFGGSEFHDVGVIHFSPSRKLDLTIVGVKILKRFVLTFDVDGRCVYLIPRDSNFYSKCFSAVR